MGNIPFTIRYQKNGNRRSRRGKTQPKQIVMENQSLHDIMINEDPKWLTTITESSDVEWLIQKEKQTRSVDRKAVINARIENLQYLAV